MPADADMPELVVPCLFLRLRRLWQRVLRRGRSLVGGLIYQR